MLYVHKKAIMTSSVLRHANKAFRPLAIAIGISAAFSPVLHAQTSTEQSLGPVMVTASRTAQKVGDVLSDHVVITAEEIAQSGQTSLIELLQTKRGIEVTRNGGPGNSASVFLRGGNAKQTVLLIDGVRSFSSTNGEPTWSAIPLSQIDRVEIVLGPLGTIYGADAVGGVIQVFTRKGDGKPHVTFSAGAGTDGEQVLTAGISGSTSGEHTIRYSFNAAHEKADGSSSTNPLAGTSTYNQDDDGYRKRSMNGQISWQLAKGQEIGFTFLNSSNDGEYDSGKASAFDTHRISDVDVYAIYSRNQITSNWTSLVQVARGYDKDRAYTSALPAQVESMQNHFSWQNDFRIDSDLLQIITERREEEVTSATAALNRNRTTDSFAAAYQLKRGAHLASVSVRDDDSSVYGSHVTGSAGYGYHISDALRLSGSLGTSFRAPTYNELYFPAFGNPTNKPEKGKNAEIGAYYDDGKSDFSIVYYHNRVTDLLVTAKPCPTGIGSSCAYNVDDALLTGLSLGAGTRMANFTLRGSLDLQNPRDRTTDKMLMRRAKTHGNISLDYAVSAFTVGADVFFSGYRFDDDANTSTRRLGGYALLNLHATYDLSNDWQLFGRWNNVTDKDYTLARGYETPGSNVFVGVRYGFK